MRNILLHDTWSAFSLADSSAALHLVVLAFLPSFLCAFFLDELTALLAYIFYLFPLFIILLADLPLGWGLATTYLPLSMSWSLLPSKTVKSSYTMPIMHRL